MVTKICPSIYNETKEPAPQFHKTDGANSRLLFVLDILLCQFVLSPLVITNWAFVWHITDATGKTLYSSAICCLINFVVFMILCLGQSHLKRHAVSTNGKALPVAASVYNIIVALASVVGWRGVWTAMDICVGTDLKSCVPSFCLGVVILVALGGIKTSSMSPPFFMMNDNSLRRNGAVFDFPTRFQQKRGVMFAMDAALTTVLSTIGVVALWRALWIPQDLLLDFDGDDAHRLRSNLLSCAAGWASTLAMITMQPCMDSVCREIEIRLGWWCRYALESTWSLIQTVPTVLLWRGIWNLGEAYLGDVFPGVPETHAALTVVSLTFLALDVLSMNSNLGAKGFARDGFGIGNFIHYLSPDPEVSRSEIP